MNMYEEKIVKVETSTTVLKIKELLENGYTWFKKNDLGYGSIQEHYNAADMQIATIRKHPLLQNLETVARVFTIIDDTKDETTTVPPVEPQNAEPVECVPSTDAKSKNTDTANRTEVYGSVNQRVPLSTEPDVEDSADAFFNI